MSGLPGGWAEARLPEMVTSAGVFNDGDWVESKDQDPDGDVRLIQLADVGDGVYRDRSARFLTEQKSRELGCTDLMPGDVLIARMPDPLGRACIFPGDTRDAITVVDVCVVRPGDGSVNPRWLSHVVNAPQTRRAIAAYQKGTTRKRISRSNLALVSFPVPPLAEQERIVAAIEEQFSRLDAGVAALERADVKLAQLRDAASLRAFELSENSLQVTTLGAICERITKGTTPTSIGHAYVDKGIYFVKVESLVNGAIDHAKCAHISAEAHADLARSQLQACDLLVSIAGTLGRVGEVAECDIPANTNQALAIVRLKDRTLAQYVKVWLESPRLRSAIRAGGKGVGMGNLTLEQIRDIPIVVPDTATRTSVLDQISSANLWAARTNDDIDRALARGAGLRSSILAAAFSGKLVPQDTKDEPASVLLERIAAERASSNGRKPTKARGQRRRKITA